MKTKALLIAATALSLVGGSAALAQPNGHAYGHQDRRFDDHRGQGHHWARGQKLPREYRANRYQVDYRRHHLRAPPRGYRWVEVDNNYVLTAIATGLIADVIAGR